jgi:hypothetical protein
MCGSGEGEAADVCTLAKVLMYKDSFKLGKEETLSTSRKGGRCESVLPYSLPTQRGRVFNHCVSKQNKNKQTNTPKPKPATNPSMSP